MAWARTGVGVSVFLLISCAALGCECADWPVKTAPSFKSASSVFVGKVTQIEIKAHRLTATLQLEKTYKGEPKAPVRVSTEEDDAACGFPFQKKERYLVFASLFGSEWRTGTCSGTTVLYGEDPVVAEVEKLSRQPAK